MLAPVIIFLGLMANRGQHKSGGHSGHARAPMPWFVLGFIALVGVNSIVTIPAEAKGILVAVTTFMLTMALAAMGLETDIGKLRAKWVRPLALGAAAFIFIAAFSLVLVKLTTT